MRPGGTVELTNIALVPPAGRNWLKRRLDEFPEASHDFYWRRTRLEGRFRAKPPDGPNRRARSDLALVGEVWVVHLSV